MRIKVRDQFTCQGCGLVTPPRFLQVDHRIPLAEGGTESDDNLGSMCIIGPEGGCHGIKSKQEALRGVSRGVEHGRGVA
jgi:5-methylcytosine-specific restriction endonuclease McrA